MITMLQHDAPRKRYEPVAALQPEADALALFDGFTVQKHGSDTPSNASPYLWINVPGFFNGRSVYAKPCAKLALIMQELNIYGYPKHADVYLKVERDEVRGFVIWMQFQQIIGSYCLLSITEDQFNAVAGLYNLDIGTKGGAA